MARMIMVLVGLALLVLGGWLGYAWWDIAVLPFLMALLVFFLALFGLTLLIFGVSEMAGRAKAAAPPADESQPGE
jgi:hypothetical protein